MSFVVNNKNELENYVLAHWNEINVYLDKYNNDFIPIYSSVDIRESDLKFAPVDNNIYPAGFNNICKKDLQLCVEQFSLTILKEKNNCRHIGIVPESHTKNLFYLDHLHVLENCLREAGFQVSIVSFDQSLFDEGNLLRLKSNSGDEVIIKRIYFDDGQVYIKGDEDSSLSLLLLNNDQSRPIDVPWKEMKIPVVPSPLIGWYQRRKTRHFHHYKNIAEIFCRDFFINPDLIQARFKEVNDVDFISKEGLQNVADTVDELLSDLPPNSNVFVKADQGTYGMGISVVSNGEDVIKMNRKNRNKMAVGKNRIEFSSVLIQEGIETILKYGDMPAEVSIYLIGGVPVGGFMRANPLKGTLSNLNANGMVFRKFCISEIRQEADHKAKEALYSVIARLSTIAGAMEIEELTVG